MTFLSLPPTELWTSTLPPNTSALARRQWALPVPVPVSARSSAHSSSATRGTHPSNSSSSHTPFWALPFPRPWVSFVLWWLFCCYSRSKRTLSHFFRESCLNIGDLREGEEGVCVRFVSISQRLPILCAHDLERGGITWTLKWTRPMLKTATSSSQLGPLFPFFVNRWKKRVRFFLFFQNYFSVDQQKVDVFRTREIRWFLLEWVTF